MGKFSEYIGSQFANPRGFVGKICCLIMNFVNKSMYKSTFKSLELTKNSMVLDVGYGNGYLIKKLYKKFSCNICGIDISVDMHKLALKKNRKGVVNEKINLIVGNCCNLPYFNGEFDAVTTVNTVYFWEDTKKGLSEIFRVIKDGGKFINTVYSQEWLKKIAYTKKGFKFFTPETLINYGYEVGFSKVEVNEILKEKSYSVTYIK